MMKPKYLLLDEPAAGMSGEEAMIWPPSSAGSSPRLGCGVLLIEHNIGLVLNICDHIHVLDSGEIIEVGPPAQIQQRQGAPRLYGHAGRSHSSACRCRGGRAVTLLAVDDITVRYGTLTALRGVTLKIDEGETLFVTGPNGAGKSTLLKAIAGVVPPVSGAITLDGAEVTGGPRKTSRGSASPWCRKGRDVFGYADHRGESEARRRHARPTGTRSLDDLGSVYDVFPMLKERRDTAAGVLSGGQQQMLVIGRALMTAPRLIAIDEPSLGLAPKVIDQVYETLLRLRDSRGLTLLIVEQSSTRAMMTGGRMILMRSGEIVLEGDARELAKGDASEAGLFRLWRPLSMTAVLQIVFDALSLGSLYALGALGIALIFGVMRLVNFAHGDYIAFCVFAMLWPSIDAAAIVFAGNLPTLSF